MYVIMQGKGVFILKHMKKILTITLALVIMLSVSGCGKFTVSREIANVDGRIITEAEFKYYLENVKMQMLSESGQYTEDDNFWEAEIDGQKAADVAKNKALDEAIRIEIACIKAEELGLSVPSENKSSINALFTSSDSAQKEQIKSIKKQTGLYEELFKDTMMKAELANEYALYMTENEGDKIEPKDEDINAYYEKEYVRVMHVLLALDEKAVSSDGEEVDPAVIKEHKKQLADEVYKKAKDGVRFESLIEEYNDDPGVSENPFGYTFTKGAMVPEFEDAAYALGIDEISEPVETSYGYHIIKRYPLLLDGADYLKAKSAIRSLLIQENYDKIIDSYKADYNIEIKNKIVENTKVKSN